MALPTSPQVHGREALQTQPRGVSPRLQLTHWPLVTDGASASPGLRLKRALFLLPVFLALTVTRDIPTLSTPFPLLR